MKTSHVEHRGVLSFSRRFPRVFVLGIVAFMFAAMSGVIPAQAAAGFSPLSVTTKATSSGKGLLSTHVDAAASAPYGVTIKIVNGTFAGGKASVHMNVNDFVVTPATAAYSCTGPNTTVQVTFDDGSFMNPIPALCGAFVPVWNQSATITVGAAGSGNASVALVNGSNASAVYVVTQDGKELSRYTVKEGASASKSLTGLTPGKTLAVYGIKDGSAPLGSPLDSALVPQAPPAPVWNQSATITVGAAGSGNASVALVNGSNASAVYVVTQDGKELSRYTVKEGASASKSLTGLTPGKTLAVYGIKDGSAPLGSPLDSALVPEKEFSSDVSPAYTGGSWNKSSHEGTLDPVGKFTYPENVYLLVYQDEERFGTAGPFSVDGGHQIRATVDAPECGDYDVYFSTTADLSGRIRWTKHVEQSDCQVDEPPHDNTSKQIGVCLWVADGKFRGYTLDMLRVGVILQGDGDSFSRHIIPPFDYTREGVKRHYDGQNWTDANQELFANGCKPALVEPPYVPNEPEVPATAVIPVVPSSPALPTKTVETKVSQVVKSEQKAAQPDRSKLTFETGVSDTVASNPIQNNGSWSAVLLTVGLAIIAGVFFRRHTVKVGK